MAKHTKAVVEGALADLRKWVANPEYGGKIVIVYRSRSKSGTSRTYSVHMIGKDRAIQLNWLSHVLFGYRIATGERDGIVVSGCGFSAHHEIAENIRRALDSIPVTFIEL